MRFPYLPLVILLCTCARRVSAHGDAGASIDRGIFWDGELPGDSAPLPDGTSRIDAIVPPFDGALDARSDVSTDASPGDDRSTMDAASDVLIDVVDSRSEVGEPPDDPTICPGSEYRTTQAFDPGFCSGSLGFQSSCFWGLLREDENQMLSSHGIRMAVTCVDSPISLCVRATACSNQNDIRTCRCGTEPPCHPRQLCLSAPDGGGPYRCVCRPPPTAR